MSLQEDLKRLTGIRDSGELSSEQYEAEKNRLLDACVDRIYSSYRLSGAARRPSVIRGIVTSVELSEFGQKATLLLDMQKVTLGRSGKPIALSEGDRLIVGGTQSRTAFHAIVYVNESNGDNSVEDLRKFIPIVIAAGAFGLLAVAAIIWTTGTAAMTHPPSLSVSGIVRTAMYAISIGAALVLAAFSLFGLLFGAHLHTLLRMIDSEHVVRTANQT